MKWSNHTAYNANQLNELACTGYGHVESDIYVSIVCAFCFSISLALCVEEIVLRQIFH